MKNLVYLGTALHMIFLTNLSPCYGMEEITYEVEDNEGKRKTMRDYSGDISPTAVIKMDTIFSLHASIVQERQVAFLNSFNTAQEVLADVSNRPTTSTLQKETIKSWLDEALATGEGAISSKFRTLNEEKTSLSEQLQVSIAEKTLLATQVQTLNGEKESFLGQIGTLNGEKESFLGQIATLNGEKESFLGQITTLNQLAEKAKAAGTWECSTNCVTG